jgi:hypothetical protein
MLTNDQLKALAERITTVIATWAVTKGYITPAQMTEYAPLAVGVAAAIYAWWVNRPKALVQAASNIPGTTVVTTPELANATPNNENILSNTDTKVVNK